MNNGPPINAHAPRLTGRSAELTDVDFRSYHGVCATQVIAGWERHGEWLLAEYRRTGKPSAWRAYMEHVAGMAVEGRKGAEQ
jgi:hypothetical protein